MTKISGIGTTETNLTNLAYMEGERGDGTSVKIPLDILREVALVEKTTSLTGLDFSSTATVSFNSEVRDTGGFYSGANPDRFTITSAGLYICGCFLRVTNYTGASLKQLTLTRKNSGGTQQRQIYAPGVYASTSSGNLGFQAIGLFDCAAGDYIEPALALFSDTSVDITATLNGFWIARII